METAAAELPGESKGRTSIRSSQRSPITFDLDPESRVQCRKRFRNDSEDIQKGNHRKRRKAARPWHAKTEKKMIIQIHNGTDFQQRRSVKIKNDIPNVHAHHAIDRGSCSFGPNEPDGDRSLSRNRNHSIQKIQRFASPFNIQSGVDSGHQTVKNGEPRQQSYDSGASIKSGRGMGLQHLQKLSTQTSAEIITVLANSRSGFEELIQSSMSPDLTLLVMKVLAKACQYEMKQNKVAVLATTCHSKFIEEVKQYLFNMLTENNEGRKAKMEDFLDDLLMFYETVMNVLPNTASEKFENLFRITDIMMNGLEKHQEKDLTKQKEKFVNLQQQLCNMIEERNREGKKVKSKDELLKYQLPPDDFRKKNVFPTVEDILDGAPFIRPNIVDGPYQDVEHYLDIHFRLLREDFIAPLREGIKEFMRITDSRHGRKRIDSVRIYHDVFFGDSKVINDRIGTVVHFDPNGRMKKMNWEYSKRFLFGSLLCFTRNNFQDIFFGTVLGRPLRELKMGRITVSLCNETGRKGLDLEGAFIMAESEAFFEPYQLVLRALQNMSEESFPMYRYIIGVEKEKRPPQYLEENPLATFRIDEKNVELLKLNSWPGDKALGLDASQYEAFKAALTEELSVIQGPPGTGKTYLGLKVARALLENSSVWNAGNTPILVVCYTNHALDQFLEGLIPVTGEIVRAGGQSKSEKLASFNLKEKRKTHVFKGCSLSLKRNVYEELRSLMRRIKTCQANIEELQRKRGVLQPEYLMNERIISKNHFECFRHKFYSPSQVMTDWLWGANLNEMDVVELIEEAGATNAAAECDEPGDVDVGAFEDEEDRIGMYQDCILFESVDVTPTLPYCVDARKLECKLADIQAEIQRCQEEEVITPKIQNNLYWLKQTSSVKNEVYMFWKSCLLKPRNVDPEHVKTLEGVSDIWHLSHENRWILYEKWVNECKEAWRVKMHKTKADYQEAWKRYEEAKQTLDFEVMQESLVVGMTTTMAARLQPLLQALKPKIVIVEEAAEVLESHIVVSLTKQCQHLILIGDHQQLCPSVSVYKLAREFHLDVSLFERMVRNGIPHYCLRVQHRMRPEIARLIVPAIYPELSDHPSVQKYPPVKGITKSLFFVSHSVKEEEVSDIRSHQNIHEAEFILHLCRYLLQQGYQSDEITILTTYKGQMFFLKQRQKSIEALCNVRITVVDNFQGEENKIILLSLVRSNDEDKIGFLKIENRVCVALSRAREGLYIIGNMDNLTESSAIWPQVKRSLEDQGCYGTALPLQCSVHPEQLVSVTVGKDFLKSAPEGGCTLPCEGILECGHHCLSVCHANNRNHKGYKCFEKCQRIPPACDLNHPCPKLCHEDCGNCMTKVERTLPCGHTYMLPCYTDPLKYNCLVIREVELPPCGHFVKKPCFENPATFPCPEKCEDRLPCGHSCEGRCHGLDDPDHFEYTCRKPCVKKNRRCTENHICAKLCYEECDACFFEVKKKLPCGHVRSVKCSQDITTVKCRRKCEKILPCGHECPRPCNEPCGGCLALVLKKVEECGHEINVKCSEAVSRSDCSKPCEKKLNCGHDCSARCCVPCSSVDCRARVTSLVQPVCGHTVEIPCFLAASVKPSSEILLSYCRAPCGEILECGHICSGTCGECLQGRIHAPCGEKCTRNLICGHKCQVNCASACPPCKARCQMKCRHSKCRMKCGIPCIPCKEPCGWRCKHSRCSKLCHEICDRVPCYEPCQEKLKCGHDCVGFCGDPCPPLCRICNEDELMDIFFGTEEGEDARFVYLVDCKHTLESGGLEQWLAQTEQDGAQVVAPKTCPKCKSNILNTQRFMNYVKEAFEDVQAVKQQIYGPQNNIRNQINEICGKIKMKKASITALSPLPPFSHFLAILNDFLRRLEPVRRKPLNNLSYSEVECLKLQVHIVLDLQNSMEKVYSQLSTETVKQTVTNHLMFLLDHLKKHDRMSKQETEDFNRECLRFLRMTKLAAIECGSTFQNAVTNPAIKKLYEEMKKTLYSIKVYSLERDEEMKRKLKQLSKEVGQPLTEEERNMIVRTMKLSQGHWYKCPNGHIYCIGNCGQANQVSKCPECKQAIGGRGFLQPGNQLAPEMSGAY